ncbi:MAG: hypothetical protein U5L74_07165 [Ideonella sp.]|nr:hypothetical protein [Ideonella sp.]
MNFKLYRAESIGGQLIAPPAGTQTQTMEGLAAALPLFGPQHFVFPFLAHALGTLVGAAVAAGVSGWGGAAMKVWPAWAVGALFFSGGLANVLMLGGPLWFTLLDLGLAYLPMAWCGLRLAATVRRSRTAALGRLKLSDCGLTARE